MTPTAMVPAQPAEPTPDAAAAAASAPVQFRNPFDAGEVFEFPPGTSLQQARESVAALLLERGRERQSHLRPERRRADTRAAASADFAQNGPRASR